MCVVVLYRTAEEFIFESEWDRDEDEVKDEHAHAHALGHFPPEKQDWEKNLES
jgi:hypothetical protein